MQIENTTPFTLEQIATFPVLGTTINTWRGRRITLYAHPTDATLLVSVGTTFRHIMRVICVEPRSAYAQVLAQAAQGKTYTSL